VVEDNPQLIPALADDDIPEIEKDLSQGKGMAPMPAGYLEREVRVEAGDRLQNILFYPSIELAEEGLLPHENEPADDDEAEQAS
jgi:hypothetical protein